MKLLLNAGFGHPLSSEDISLIKSLGFDGVRQDINTVESAAPLLDNLLSRGLEVLAIVRDVDVAREVARLGDNRVSIELGNEEDRHGKPEEYFMWAVAAYRAIRAVNSSSGGDPTRVISAGITTPDTKRLEWLREVYRRGMPDNIEVGIHTYRSHTTPSTPHPGFPSRSAEFTEVRKITSNRPIHITEIGWHTVKTVISKGFLGLGKKSVQWNDEQVREFATQEAKGALAEGVKSFTWFQLNDGPEPGNHEHHYGVRRLDGSLKPVAEVFK